ncbi:pectin acetylesterase 2-like [Lycium ferocissimum]|uniref:pectin acetylesterase 2-like n=1 Tax=Lycium ferocissimum TaxID=112874 RepID=UPI002814DF34|nr:pectin acetylesterase 2-like [Lycium ferocissimum]
MSCILQIAYTLTGSTTYECIKNGTCTRSENNTIQGMRSDFLNALPKGNPKLRGVFIDAVPHHTNILTRWTLQNSTVIHNVSAPKAFADWYFDRNYTYLIDEHNLPVPDIVPK